MEFTYELNIDSSSTMELKLKGYFDEFSTLPEDIDLSECEKFNVDFGEINFINSGGIKLWVNFAETLEEHENLKVFFFNCRRPIVDQVNLLKGFLPANGSVQSVYVPLHCNKCDKSFEVHQELKTDVKTPNKIAEKTEDPNCGEFPACKKNHEIEIAPEQYFRFQTLTSD